MTKMKSNISVAVSLILLTTVCTLFLSFANSLYQNVLAGRQRELRMKIYEGFGQQIDISDFDSQFMKNVTIKEDKKNIYYTLNGGALAGLQVVGPGLWGDIELLLIIDFDAEIIREMTVLSQIETAGLGARIEEQWFLDQFRNLDYSNRVRIEKEKRGTPGEVDAISGATKTSKSLEALINTSLERYLDKGPED